jgi:hypothetical protein
MTQLGTQVVYLAGPEVFLPGAQEIGLRKKSICESYGFEGRFPLDRLPNADAEEPLEIAQQIFEICIDMMNGSDLIVANMTPFRGVSLDVGTAVELGYMYGLGKPIFGYSAELVEDFGLSDNLMCEGVVRWPKAYPSNGPPLDLLVIRNGVPQDQLFSSLAGFEEALRQARKYVDGIAFQEGLETPVHDAWTTRNMGGGGSV